MGEVTSIGWCHHTFNAWQGCQAVSPACDFCYAEAQDRRFKRLDRWGPHGVRERTSVANWRKPRTWDRAAEMAGERRRVFANSKADVFDNHAPRGARADLFKLIRETPHLDWLLLTKRPENMPKPGMLPDDWGDGYPNVWLGTTIEDAPQNRRALALLSVPAVVHFVSAEPLLGNPELHAIPTGDHYGRTFNALTGYMESGQTGAFHLPHYYGRRIKWVIGGGESGNSRGIRWTPPARMARLLGQCVTAGVPFYLKQWGGIGGSNKKAGRLLDGVEYSQFPVVSHA